MLLRLVVEYIMFGSARKVSHVGRGQEQLTTSKTAKNDIDDGLERTAGSDDSRCIEYAMKFRPPEGPSEGQEG